MAAGVEHLPEAGCEANNEKGGGLHWPEQNETHGTGCADGKMRDVTKMVERKMRLRVPCHIGASLFYDNCL